MAYAQRHDDGRIAEDIYFKQLQVTVKNSDFEERNVKLTVSAQFQTTSTLYKKDFVVRLTDDVDPLFYYHLRLNDEDYQSLRTNQGLLVDFSSFPQKVIDLLDLCFREEGKTSPKFILQLQLLNGTGLLNIVEVNPFKHLIHLHLKLVSGCDAEIKRYLADTIKQLKSKNDQLNSSLKSTENELNKRMRELNDVLLSNSAEIERLKNELKEQSSQLSERYGNQLAHEKDKIIKIQCDLQEKFERERREIEYNRNKIVGALETNVMELESKVRELTENKYRYETSIFEMQSKVNSFENELKSTREEALELKKENMRLENSKVELERACGQMSMRLANVEHEAREYDAFRVKMQAALDAAHEQKNRFEAEMEQKAALLNKREKTLKTLSDDMNKGNEIIRKLQAEIRAVHAKLKLRSKVAQEQEKVVQDKERQAEMLQNETVTLQQKIRVQQDEIAGLKEALDAAQTKAEEAEKTLKTNENVINWLNKQLNEVELNQRRTPSHLGLQGISSANPLSSSTPINSGDNQNKQAASYNSSVDALKVPMAPIVEEKEAAATERLSRFNNKENKSDSSTLSSKYFCPRPTQRGLVGGSDASKEKNRDVYNIRMPKNTVIPLGPNSASSQFPIAFQPSAYFPL